MVKIHVCASLGLQSFQEGAFTNHWLWEMCHTHARRLHGIAPSVAYVFDVVGLLAELVGAMAWQEHCSLICGTQWL